MLGAEGARRRAGRVPARGEGTVRALWGPVFFPGARGVVRPGRPGVAIGLRAESRQVI
ncbi:hypothetical protein GCM10010348_48570 [Streptomyces anthocyanicus]|nr:hypothetical protein GCM10010348_48570 [Streptomyces anthocyanicus]